MKYLLFNPFVRIAGVKALIIGLVSILISSALAGVFATRFDGAIDAHFGGEFPFYVPFLDNLINLACLTVVFYLLALFLTKGRTRFIDILGTFSMARFPYLLVPLLNVFNVLGEIGNKILFNVTDLSKVQLTTFEITYLICTTVIILLIVIWYIALLYRAYTISTNLKDSTAIISFIFGLILAEISSSILIHSFL